MNPTIGTILYFTLFIMYCVKSMKTANMDSIYYAPIIANISILKFILVFIIVSLLLSRVISYFQPLYILKETFSPLLIMYCILFSFINLVIPRSLPKNISPADLKRQERIIIQYRYTVLIILYIAGFVVYMIFVGSIGQLATNTLQVKTLIGEKNPDLFKKPEGPGGDGEGETGGKAGDDK